VKGLLNTNGDVFVSSICDGEDVNIQKSMDLGISVSLVDTVGKFYYLEDILGRGGNSASVVRVHSG